jgi:hypothetical protein
VKQPPATAGSSATISDRSAFLPAARSDAYTPAIHGCHAKGIQYSCFRCCEHVMTGQPSCQRAVRRTRLQDTSYKNRCYKSVDRQHCCRSAFLPAARSEAYTAAG